MYRLRFANERSTPIGQDIARRHAMHIRHRDNNRKRERRGHAGDMSRWMRSNVVATASVSVAEIGATPPVAAAS